MALTSCDTKIASDFFFKYLRRFIVVTAKRSPNTMRLHYLVANKSDIYCLCSQYSYQVRHNNNGPPSLAIRRHTTFPVPIKLSTMQYQTSYQLVSCLFLAQNGASFFVFLAAAHFRPDLGMPSAYYYQIEPPAGSSWPLARKATANQPGASTGRQGQRNRR